MTAVTFNSYKSTNAEILVVYEHRSNQSIKIMNIGMGKSPIIVVSAPLTPLVVFVFTAWLHLTCVRLN